MASRKVRALTLLGVLGALLGLLLILGNMSLGAFTGFLRSPTGFFLGGAGDSTVNFTATLSTATRPIIKFEGPLESFTADLPGPSSLVLNELTRNSTTTSRLEVSKFEGKLNLAAQLDIDAAGEVVKIGSDVWSITNKRVSVKGGGLEFSAASLKKVPRLSFTISNATGSVIVEGGKGVFNFANEPLEIVEFTGSIDVSGNSISLNGSGKIKTRLVKSPG